MEENPFLRGEAQPSQLPVILQSISLFKKLSGRRKQEDLGRSYERHILSLVYALS